MFRIFRRVGQAFKPKQKLLISLNLTHRTQTSFFRQGGRSEDPIEAHVPSCSSHNGIADRTRDSLASGSAAFSGSFPDWRLCGSISDSGILRICQEAAGIHQARCGSDFRCGRNHLLVCLLATGQLYELPTVLWAWPSHRIGFRGQYR